VSNSSRPVKGLASPQRIGLDNDTDVGHSDGQQPALADGSTAWVPIVECDKAHANKGWPQRSVGEGVRRTGQRGGASWSGCPTAQAQIATRSRVSWSVTMGSVPSGQAPPFWASNTTG